MIYFFLFSRRFQSIEAKRLFNTRQPVFALDHDVQNKTEGNLSKYKKIQEFAKKHEVDFYPAGRGIGHQVMVEEGYAFPLNLTVASDSHSNMYGGVGSLGTPVVRTDGMCRMTQQHNESLDLIDFFLFLLFSLQPRLCGSLAKPGGRCLR